jgi:aminoglycoside phosphotransferase (APT) family kinase protein
VGKFEIARRKAQAREKLDYLQQHRLSDCITRAREIIEAAPDDYRARTDTLVHGDLYCRHLIVNKSAMLAGVIYWGDVHAGDPASDLMVAWTMLPAGARDEFFSSYGEIAELTGRTSRFRAVNHSSAVAEYAHRIDDPDLLRESLIALAHATR